MALMYISSNLPLVQFTIPIPFSALLMKAKRQKWAASLLRALKSFHLKPEQCAELPCAELVLYALLHAFLAGRTHLQMPKLCS